jgi:hypothetical protein
VPAQGAGSGNEHGRSSLRRRKPQGKVEVAGPRGGSRRTWECDGEHEEENAKGNPSALSSQIK